MKYNNGVLASLNGSRTALYGYDQRMETPAMKAYLLWKI